MAAETLDVPPFPPLRWDKYFWVGEVTLPSWAGFQTRRGPYGAVSSKKPSDGSARLNVTPEDDERRSPPLAAQVAAFRHLLDNEPAVAASILRAAFDRYPAEKAAYADAYSDEEAAEVLPDIDGPAGLRSLIGLSDVHVLSVAKDGAAYVGFEFGCVWDPEHGFGVMTHLGRVVKVGQADVAFQERAAMRDAGPAG
jgi:hypothetical protein